MFAGQFWKWGLLSKVFIVASLRTTNRVGGWQPLLTLHLTAISWHVPQHRLTKWHKRHKSKCNTHTSSYFGGCWRRSAMLLNSNVTCHCELVITEHAFYEWSNKGQTTSSQFYFDIKMKHVLPGWLLLPLYFFLNGVSRKTHNTSLVPLHD